MSRYGLLAVGMIGAIAVTDLSAETVVLPKECETALRRSVELLRNSTLEYTLDWDVNRTAGRETGRSPLTRCVLANDSFYHRQDPDPARPQLPIAEMAFDGKVFSLGSRTTQPGLSRFLGENPGDGMARNVQVTEPYLEAIGFPLPLTVADWKSSRMESFLLSSLKAGRLLKVSQNGDTLQLELEVPDPEIVFARELDLIQMATNLGPTDPNTPQWIQAYRELGTQKAVRLTKVTLDRTKGWAILRREDRTPDGKLIRTIECSELASFEQEGLWLPKSCTIREFVKRKALLKDFTDEPYTTRKLTLSNFSRNIPADVTFTLDLGPGTLITERSTRASLQNAAGYDAILVPKPPAQIPAK